MPAATRLGDLSSGHDSCAPVPLVTGSPNVFINGKPAGRVGDSYASHGCLIHPGHQDSITGGSGRVFINGMPAARVGDAVSNGSSVAQGSSNVFIG